MIRGFADKATERLFRNGVCPARWRPLQRQRCASSTGSTPRHGSMIWRHHRAI
jgi:hypothetical protein